MKPARRKRSCRLLRFGVLSRSRICAQGPVIDPRAIIGERDDCTAVAFAGTDPALARNLITDADCRLTASDTHEGFQDAFDAVWPLIEPKIRAGRPPLFFTGHSFGAALAVLAAEKAHDIGIAPAAGSPL